jgi:hypothetical protein
MSIYAKHTYAKPAAMDTLLTTVSGAPSVGTEQQIDVKLLNSFHRVCSGQTVLHSLRKRQGCGLQISCEVRLDTMQMMFSPFFAALYSKFCHGSKLTCK